MKQLKAFYALGMLAQLVASALFFEELLGWPACGLSRQIWVPTLDSSRDVSKMPPRMAAKVGPWAQHI